jgi:competence protein ComEA
VTVVDPSAPPWHALEAETASAAEPPPRSSPLRSWVPLACFALAAVLAGAAFVVAAGGAGTVSVDGALVAGSEGPVSGGSDRPSSMASDAAARSLLVEVSGAVARPGVYRLAPGSRVIDALTAAGGFGPRVDTSRADADLNLAAPVNDGVEIHVPSRDDPVGHATAPPPSGGGVAGPVDLNTASESALEALPGVGPATVAKIVAGRPYASVDDLKAKGVVGEKTLEKLRPLVTVGQ